MKSILRHNIDILKRYENYYLYWSVINLSNSIFEFKKGMALTDQLRPSVHPRFIMLNFTKITNIQPKEELLITNEHLVKDKVSNYRFWFNKYSSIGLEGIDSIRYNISVSQYKNLVKKLEGLVEYFSLPKEIDEGLLVDMKRQDSELDKVIASNGTQSIIELEFEEGYNPNHATEEDVVFIHDK